MKVTIADYAGFCFGVERAIKIVKDASSQYSNVVTFGPIIHNPQVVKELEKSGIWVKNTLQEIEPEMTTVIRTHGTEINTLKELQNLSKDVIDATCPFVKKVQSAARSLSAKGMSVIVVGEDDHPEVQGIVSYIEGEYFVVSSDSEAQKLPWRPAYGVVAQTTQNEKTYETIINIVREKCEKIEVAHTICNATHRRQEAALELAGCTDVMVIVGGKNSANTTRLYQLCRDVCPRTYLVETAEELNKDMFEGARHVGVSAGASTPNNIVNQVREYILENANEQ